MTRKPAGHNGDGLAALPRRERQVMEIILRRGAATASEVLAELPDAPTNSAIRGALRHLPGSGFRLAPD